MAFAQFCRNRHCCWLLVVAAAAALGLPRWAKAELPPNTAAGAVYDSDRYRPSVTARFTLPVEPVVLERVVVCLDTTSLPEGTKATLEISLFEGDESGSRGRRLTAVGALAIDSSSRQDVDVELSQMNIAVAGFVFAELEFDPMAGGAVRLCDDRLRTPAPAVAAVSPFTQGAGKDTVSARLEYRILERQRCARDSQTACLLEGRFEIRVNMWDFSNPPSGPGKLSVGRIQQYGGASSETSQSVSFFSFMEGNVEVFVKMLDACSSPGFNSFWVFAAGATTAETEILIRDSVTDRQYRIYNPRNRPFQVVTDTAALKTCSATTS